MPRLIDADKLHFDLALDGAGHEIRFIEAKNIHEAPTIDPVHAAGGCYCGECGYLGSDVFYDDSFYCHYWGYSIREDDFCSRGERREENEPGVAEQ